VEEIEIEKLKMRMRMIAFFRSSSIFSFILSRWWFDHQTPGAGAIKIFTVAARADPERERGGAERDRERGREG
jgi:hypothetical protein